MGSKWVTKTELNIWGHEELVTSRKKSGADYVQEGIDSVGGLLMMASMLANWRKNSAVEALARDLEKAIEYGDYDAQIRITGELIDRYGSELPDTEYLYTLRASAYYSVGNFDKALADARSAVLLNDAHVEGYVAVGRCLERKSEWAAAIKAYTEALRRDPANSIALSGRADALAEVGNHSAALADMDRLVSQEPGDEYFVWQRGKIRLAGGDASGALTDMEMAIRLAPSEPTPYRTRAEIYRVLGHEDEATSDEDTARQLDIRQQDMAMATAICTSRDMFAVLQPYCNMPTNSEDARRRLPDVLPYLVDDELLGAALCVSPPYTSAHSSPSFLLGFRTCVLAVTDRRLLFVGSDLRKRSLVHEYFPSMIRSMKAHEEKNSTLNGRIEMICDGGTVQFYVAVASKGKARSFADVVMRWLVQHRSGTRMG